MLRNAQRITLATSFVASTLLAACGSSGSPKLDTGYPRNTTVDTVTTTDLQRMCMAAEEVANRIAPANTAIRAHCTWYGIELALDNDNPALCPVARDGCIDAPPFEITQEIPQDLGCDSLDTTDIVGCTASVAQIEECANAQSRRLDEIFAAIDCELAADPVQRAQVEAMLDSVNGVPECAGLHDVCSKVRFLRDVKDVVPH